MQALMIVVLGREQQQQPGLSVLGRKKNQRKTRT